MSHFAVAVITDDVNRINDMLEPYSENLDVEPYIAETKEQIIQNARERRERYIKELQEEGKIAEWQQKYIDAETDEELYETQIDEDEKYDKQGNRLTTYNPNSKWDWYEIGGRWHNNLLVKEEIEDIIDGSASWGNLSSNTKKSPKGYKWCDGAKIKDIDFKKKIEFENRYNKAIRFWEMYVEGQEPKTEEEKEEIEFELGEMGWFGMADDTEESEQRFIDKFTETINKNENQDKYLVLVDCHI